MMVHQLNNKAMPLLGPLPMASLSTNTTDWTAWFVPQATVRQLQCCGVRQAVHLPCLAYPLLCECNVLLATLAIQVHLGQPKHRIGVSITCILQDTSRP